MRCLPRCIVIYRALLESASGAIYTAQGNASLGLLRNVRILLEMWYLINHS
jgi:hypothetical protein